MNILFALAHPDDEAFGPAGTIAKLSENNNVWVISLCKGNRPGVETVSLPRQEAFYKSCSILGATGILFDSSDLHLEYHKALGDLESVLRDVKPEKVFTHNTSDVHKDHRLTAEVVLAACRPTASSKIKELYFSEMPASTAWAFGQLGPTFVPNYYIDITGHMERKTFAMSLYKTEIYKFPDARSLEGMYNLARNRGSEVGCKYAEAFKLVYSRN